jgi:hypothetical protein
MKEARQLYIKQYMHLLKAVEAYCEYWLRIKQILIYEIKIAKLHLTVLMSQLISK